MSCVMYYVVDRSIDRDETRNETRESAIKKRQQLSTHMHTLQTREERQSTQAHINTKLKRRKKNVRFEIYIKKEYYEKKTLKI